MQAEHVVEHESEGDEFDSFGSDAEEEEEEFSDAASDEQCEKLQMFSDEDEDDLEEDDEVDFERDDDDEDEQDGFEGCTDDEVDDADNIDYEDENNNNELEDYASLPPTVLKEKINADLALLSDWKAARDRTTQSRSEVLARWQKLVAAYYGYSEFMVGKLAGDGLFGCEEALQFFEANEAPRPVTIRCNTLKTRRRDLMNALTNRGATVQALAKWTPVGLQVFDSPVPIGATPEYLAGQYMLQAASSLLPVQALAAQPGQRVLDMSAAPGGKTTHLAAEMRNSGVLVANDASRDRIKALLANIHRMGVRNTVVCCQDGRKLPHHLGRNGFDRVLLDAPCSGTGVISKDPTVKAGKTQRDFVLLTHLQKELIMAAIDLCAVGGSLVYSTCSVTVEENEEIVNYALSKRGHQVRLVDCNLEFGRPGFTAFRGKHFHPSVRMTRRFYPHTHNMDGFFVAKFEKFSCAAAAAGAGADAGADADEASK